MFFANRASFMRETRPENIGVDAEVPPTESGLVPSWPIECTIKPSILSARQYIKKSTTPPWSSPRGATPVERPAWSADGLDRGSRDLSCYKSLQSTEHLEFRCPQAFLLCAAIHGAKKDALERLPSTSSQRELLSPTLVLTLKCVYGNRYHHITIGIYVY